MSKTLPPLFQKHAVRRPATFKPVEFDTFRKQHYEHNFRKPSNNKPAALTAAKYSFAIANYSYAYGREMIYIAAFLVFLLVWGYFIGVAIDHMDDEE